MKSSLSIIFFHSVIFKESSPNSRSSRFSSMLSSRSFILSCFTFRSMTHFELIFINTVRSVSISNFLYVHIWLFQHHLLTRLSFLHCIAFALLSSVSSPRNWGFLIINFICFLNSKLWRNKVMKYHSFFPISFTNQPFLAVAIKPWGLESWLSLINE